ncbi:DUF1127 domain-containing protein [Tropicimonas aquimaris]|uniref:DUF1127 domain-containing protein n=1 Tax=Tropicimonas aquimaris TaxID=914152 RepID=A0ABW3IMQ0_9RHOB
MSVTTSDESRISFLEVLTAPIDGALALFSPSCRHSRRMKRIDFLNGLTNEQLAQRGLRRNDIVRHVYRTAHQG